MPPENENSILALKSVTFSFSEQALYAGLDFEQRRGIFTCLLGPNGCGKSTLIRLLAGIYSPSQGEIIWENRALSAIPARQRPEIVGYLPAETVSYLPYTIEQMVELHTSIFSGGILSPDRQRAQRYRRNALNLLEEFQLAVNRPGAGRRRKNIEQFSSGEKKRLYLALALAANPRFLLLDEPDTHLDIHIITDIFRKLKSLAAEGKGVLLATHNINAALRFADRFILIDQQHRLLHNGRADNAFWRQMTKIYGGAFRRVRCRSKSYIIPD